MEVIWEFILNYLDVISGFVLGLALFGPFLLKFKSTIKELSELLVSVYKALEDNKITKEEALIILKEAKDVIWIYKK